MAQKLSEVILGSDKDSKKRAWCFTLNNYGDSDIKRICELGKNGTYVIFGKEIGEKCGTPHLQGYIHWKNARTFKSMKKILGDKFHIEAARGSVDENVKYCSKENNVTEIGDKPCQGNRIDISTFVQDIENGDSDEELWVKHPACMVKYRKAKEDRKNCMNGKIVRDCPEIKVIVGPPGCGKTRSVIENEPKLWNAPSDYQWFDGYCGQEAVLFDDYEGEIEYRFLLKLLDRYKMQVPIKGGFTWWIPKRIYITSNVEIEKWYKGRRDIGALMRRINEFKMKEV